MSAATWNLWAADWLLDSKVNFEGSTRVIRVNEGVTALDIRSDVYTAWVDWIALRDNTKYLPAVRVTGLDPIGGGVYTGDTYFLVNGWKLVVDISKVRITGVLFSDDYDTAYYTSALVAQYPATVSSLVTTVSVGSSTLTAADVWSHEPRTVSGGLTAAQVWEHNLKELTQTVGLTPFQELMLSELYKLSGLLSGTPLVINDTSNTRQAGDVLQSIITSGPVTTVTRI